MKRKLLTALLSGALMLTALAGCGQRIEDQSGTNSTSADGESVARDELVFVNYRDIRDLNPHLYAGEMYAQSILYDTLVSNTSEGYVGCLAEDWTISEDGRTYTFNIRDGVTFSDGTPCDANAILANFNAILENRERHTWLEMMNLLVGVSAPDDDTFVIEMSEPYYENVKRLMGLPDLDDMDYDPAGTYQKLTGVEKADATSQDCMGLVMEMVTDKLQQLCKVKPESADGRQTYGA